MAVLRTLGIAGLAAAGAVACSVEDDASIRADSSAKTDGQAAVWFANEAAERGIQFHHRSGYEDRPLLPEITGGGAALADFNGDGHLDAYLVQSGSLYEDRSGSGNRLFFNRGDGTFAEAADANGAAHTGYGMGAAVGDYDNDGDVDLYVTNVGPNVLFRNDGAGGFTDVSASAGVDEAGWSTSAAFFDFDGDGDLDLYHTNYINWSIDNELNCYIGNVLSYCPPANYNAPDRDHLYRNNGDGTFTDVSRDAGLDLRFGNGFGVVGGDFNGDGLTDLFVANDMMMDQLWLNQGDLRFRDECTLWGCAVDEHGIAKAGMGVAAADIDNDGDKDAMVVNLEGQTDSYFRNENGYFADATAAVGLGITGRYTRWGVVFADFDNDGALDLYEANGMVGYDTPVANSSFAEPNVLYQGIGKRFLEVDPQGGVAPPLQLTSRGMATGDVDGDGGLDLLIVNRDGPANLLMNRVASRGNWAMFRATVGAPPRDAHGATVSGLVAGTRVYRDVQPEGSYLASSDPRVHFGLGDARVIEDVRVRWPGRGEDGRVVTEQFGDFAAGEVVLLARGGGEVVLND